MTFVSSSCVKHNKIKDSINELVDFGFNSIELSGGTKPYAELESDLLHAKNDLGVNLLLHNYFPPPSEDFVLNLASANDKIYQMSLDHCKKAIELSYKIGAKKIGFHAGFLIDIKVEEIGKKLSYSKVIEKNKALDIFCQSIELLSSFSNNDIDLYVENNVFSESNHQSFNGNNPLLLTNLSSYNEISQLVDFKLLLDVAHLKVSCKTLECNFDEELVKLFQKSDYIHLSDNDSLHDTNNGFEKNSELYSQISDLNWGNKTVTIEVYESLDIVKQSLNNINSIINA